MQAQTTVGAGSRPRFPGLQRCHSRAGARSYRNLLFLAALYASTCAAQATWQTAWFAPRAADFAAASQPLAPAITALCAATDGKAELAAARGHWLQALLAWERLSTVTVGPLLQQRLQRRLDFNPTRPRLIVKAVKAAPKTLADLEHIGTPAKGLPALAWLLWSEPVQPASAECRYAALLASELAAEAQTLAQVTRDSEPAPLADLVNQWVAGLERLRWTQMEMPLRVALTGGGTPDYPRGPAAAAAWAAQWQALREIAGHFSAWLKTQGDPANAEALSAAVARTDAAMQGLSTVESEAILTAATRLAELKRLMEEHTAPALGVVIGFSDADGD